MIKFVRISCILIAACLLTAAASAQQPIARTAVITAATNGHAETLTAEIGEARHLYLVVSDGGNGFSFDWANWIDPKLKGPAGTLSLAGCSWKSANSGWGDVRQNQNAGGGPMTVEGKTYPTGIGTHAPSVIHYEIPPGYSSLSVLCALDDGGTHQDGSSSSVRFAVYTEPPPSPDDLRTPEAALAGLETPDDLQATLVAAEPMLFSPSNIDVDHLGRIWICEVVNYRHFANKNNPAREDGDRILVLEDTDGDGKADQSTTFYQGRDIDSAHGVCVLGSRVIVSAGDSVFSLYDDDGDLKADRKEVLFTGIKGVQHDHGIHSFTFGPDGRLYFNFGNNGEELYYPDGSPVVDLAGNVVKASRQPYQEGMAFRCELDGSSVDTLGWNFRNNWELAVDSFGTVWQSDNDDDGNRGVRINYVMEYGNYGYKDEFTGAGWREARTNLEPEIPHRHWHLNDPGVVPNLLQTGAGSPTGIIVYEGDFLPQRFRDQLIHCDAGPNIVRSYAVKSAGAGYTAEINPVLEGVADRWFRPSDVCVAPDGSLIIADWYDPGVGGHRQGDIERGRIFRIAPKGAAANLQFEVPDLTTMDGCIKGLCSPNTATRYIAWTYLHDKGAAAAGALSDLYGSATNPRFRARALWLLGQIPEQGAEWIRRGLTDSDPDIRITALRVGRRMNQQLSTYAELVNDSSAAVRRELALALRHQDSPEAVSLWGALAMRYQGSDRWMLEALGIAADGRWNECLAELNKQAGTEDRSEGTDDLIWRSRADQSAELLASRIQALAADGRTGPRLLRLFRAFDFLSPKVTSAVIPKLLTANAMASYTPEARPVVIAESLQRISIDSVRHSQQTADALESALEELRGTGQFVRLIRQFEITARYPELLALAQKNPAQQIGLDAITALLDLKQWPLFMEALTGEDTEAAIATAQAMGNSANGRIAGPLLAVIRNPDIDLSVRQAAVRGASAAGNAVAQLVQLVEKKELDPDLSPAVAAALHGARSRNTRELAQRLFPLPPAKEGTPLPPISELTGMSGNTKNGRLVFHTNGTCHKCHVIDGLGREVGPNLSEIGSKLSRQAMFESILYPSAGISHNYEAYTLILESGTTVTGLITSETADSISIRSDDALIRTFPLTEVEEKVKQSVSLMPADLQKTMTTQELVDLVDYLQTLKKK